MPDLSTGDIVWLAPDVAVGREQTGRRPALIIAGPEYLETVDTVAIVVPPTTVNRGWPNHVLVEGAALAETSWAMTEQVRTVSRERIVGDAGRVAPETVDAVRAWVRDFLDL